MCKLGIFCVLYFIPISLRNLEGGWVWREVVEIKGGDDDSILPFKSIISVNLLIHLTHLFSFLGRWAKPIRKQLSRLASKRKA